MLLNQCLALSLSFRSHNESPSSSTSSSFSPSSSSPSSSSSSTSSQLSRDDNENELQHRQANIGTKSCSNQINQSTALNLFDQLVLENSNSTSSSASSRSQGGRKSDNLKILAQVFKRVEFAGFVVPSWLLLSGTYDDLHCIKSNWATGQLRAPKGLRIETIGNIRSMNVDYFGEPPRKPPSVGTEMMIEHSKNAATTTSLSENRQQQQLTASTTSTRRQRPTSEMEPNAGAELEARVLCSLRWLASARLMDKVGLEQLTAFIGNKWPQQKELATLDSIERTTRALTQQGRLQMGRFEGALETRPGVQEETSTGQGWFVQLPHCSTVMATATMISTSIQEPNTTTSPSATISGRNSASSTRSAKSKSTTLDSGLGGGCSSSGTGGGGSSGCDVDDSGSPMNERDATAVAQASLVDDEFQPSAQLAVVEKAPQSGSSILSRLRVARSTSRRRHRVDDGLEEFSSGGCEAASRTFASELPAPRQVLVADEGSGRGGETETPRLPDSTSRQRRRGFSLTRSLSFRPAQKASQQQQQQQQSASNKDTSQASAAATVQLGVGAQLDYGEHHLQNQNTPSKQTTTTASHQQPTTTTNRLNANLSSLFRSKSMRVVSSSSSSGRARAVENAANLDCDNDDDDDELNDDDYADDDYNVGNADHYHHHRQQQQQQQQHRRRRRRWRRRDDISRASPRDTSARLRRDTSVACRGQHEATIDYLTQASTQRHSASQHLKRTFSMRRNSILAFGKDELGGGAGRIAMFLRRLFNIGRATAAATGGAARNRQRADACVATALVDSSEHCFAESTDQQQRGQLDTTTQQPPPPPTQPAHRGCSVHHLVDIHHHHHSSTTTAAHTKQWWPLENGSTEECACKQTVGDLNNNNNNDHHKNHRHEDDAPHHQHQHCHQDNADAEARLLEDVDQRRRRARPRRHNRDEFAPAAADEEEEVVSLSPSQNSLIEILDCSRSIEESKRDLRQVPARSSDTTSHRATWKLIKRSESSLSQRSNTSCSTNKSTVSQQLRRHLDEAYKRHRNCTSKRERDFIDSINVLRQASRHASLENSRSSSKNRRHRSHHQHNPTGSATANGANQQQQQHANLKSSSSQTTTTSPSSAVSASSSSSSARRRRSANDSSDVDDSTNSSRLDSFTSPLESTTTVSSSSGAGEPRGPQDLSKVSIEDDEDFFIRSATAKLVAAANLQQWPVQLTKLPVTEAELNDDVIGSPEPVACDCCCPMVVTSSSSSATMAIPPNQQQQLQPSGMMIDARQAQSASLCDGQFNCCQALVDHHHHHQQAALAALAQSLPACCLTLQPLTTQPNFGSQLEPLLPAANHLNHHHHHHHNNSNNNQPKQQQLNQLALQTNNVETGGGGSSLCCPIWRSMIYSYCQQQQASAAAGALPFNVIASAAIAAAANGAADGQSPPGNILPGAGFPTGGFNLCEMPGQGIIGQHQNHIHHQQQQQPSSSQPLDGGDSISRPSLSSSFSTTQLSTNQQQQHNTTIDLKIEIGADFKKLAAKSLARRRDYHGLAPRSISARLKQTARAASAAANQPSSSSSDDNTTTDSLDNQLDSRHLSEEAYSEQSTSVTDESLPTEPFESLRSGAWRQTVTESAKSKTKGSSNNNTRKEFQTKARDLTTSCDDAEDDDEAGQAGQDDHSMPSALGQEQQLDSARRRRDVLTH